MCGRENTMKPDKNGDLRHRHQGWIDVPTRGAGI
jgi:hypothetical protein